MRRKTLVDGGVAKKKKQAAQVMNGRNLIRCDTMLDTRRYFT